MRELGVELPPLAAETEAGLDTTAPPPRQPYEIAGAIAPGAYGNVVTLGAFAAVKVDAGNGSIEPGDLLVASSLPGFATSDPDPRSGTTFGKALGELRAGSGVIPVLVNQQ
jgi:hypothetical protein